ncbi:hypothetical protein C823_007470 [Eubacterium plexicaudatum ASF492]|nr:hypothetical protein C823_007470 [Eubacterium plexicaudatum ASF492]
MERPDTDDAWQPVRYVYALAVLPQFRGRGVGAGLLRRAHELYHAPLIAEPAEAGLIGGFYEPLGFTSDFYIKKVRWNCRSMISEPHRQKNGNGYRHRRQST